AITRADIVGALNTILEYTPYGPNVEDAKTITLQTLFLVLNSTKGTNIPSIVKALSSDAQDMLIQYIDKGMAMSG
ncbi:actin-related protein 2/3 complex subunit 5, partial [Gautieria morchelliformis]